MDFYLFSLKSNFSYASTEIKIISKINNEIITSFDVEKEYDYLIALNNELREIPKKEALKVAKNSLIREKIKTSEIKKFYVLENFDRYEYLNKVFQNFYQKLNISNEEDFNNYLTTYGLTIEEVKHKIKLEILWNQLIGSKFKDQIKVDEEVLKRKMIENRLNTKYNRI